MLTVKEEYLENYTNTRTQKCLTDFQELLHQVTSMSIALQFMHTLRYIFMYNNYVCIFVPRVACVNHCRH